MTATQIFVLALASWPAAAQDKVAQSTVALDGIAHVAFRVSDLAVSREFYRKLGFEPAFEFSDAAGTTVSYMKVDDRQFIELYRRGQTDKERAAQPLGLMHICFDTHDMEGLHAEYLKREMKPTDTQKAGAGNLLFTMRDPDGQLLEYTQYMPGSRHTNARGQFLDARRISQHLVGVETTVKDVVGEEAFYTGKLGFTKMGNGTPVRLRIAGNSGEEVDLESVTAGTKARIVLAVTDLTRTTQELRSRGITAITIPGSVTITDPDGTVLEFMVVSTGSR